MENLDTSNLEDSLNVATDKDAVKNQDVPEQEGLKMTPEEEIGFHKGALNTLVAERNELIKMIGNIEAILKAHLDRLKELGVDLQEKKSE